MIQLCLGTVQLGLKYGIHGSNLPNPEIAMKIMDSAYSHGITCFDTAAAYGSAEDVVGNFINTRKPTDLRIVSKLRPNALINSKDYVLDITNEITNSLKRLGIVSLDGYMFHNASSIFDKNAVVALEKIKDLGFTRNIGVSVYTPEEAVKTLEYDNIDIIQIPYNVLDRRLDKVGFFEEAKRKNISVYVRSVLLQGLLTMDEMTVPRYMGFALPTLKRYWKICQDFGLSAFQAAVQYILSKNNIDYLVFGVDNEDQLDEFLAMKVINGDDLMRVMDDEFSDVENRILMPNLWR